MTTPPPLPVPQPGQQIPAYPGPQGQAITPPQNMGLMGYRDPRADQIAQGMNAFMRNYFMMKDNMRQHYRGMYEDAMTQIAQGRLNPATANMKQIAKWGKMGGVPGNWHGESDQDAWIAQKAQYDAQQQQQQQDIMSRPAPQPAATSLPGQQATPPMPAGPPPVGGMSTMMSPAVPGQAATPPQQLNPAVQQLLSAGVQGPSAVGTPPAGAIPMGRAAMSPNIANSPMAQLIMQRAQASWPGAPENPANIAQRGRINQLQQNIEELYDVPLHRASVQQKLTMMQHIGGLTDAAYQGDPRALEMLIRSDVLKGVPMDDFINPISMVHPDWSKEQIHNYAGQAALWGMIGKPFMTMQMGMLDKVLPRFVDYANPTGAAMTWIQNPMQAEANGIRPMRTAEEQSQFSKVVADITRTHPGASWNSAQLYQTAKTFGQDNFASQIAKTWGPTAQQAEAQRFWSGEMPYRRQQLQNEQDRIRAEVTDNLSKSLGHDFDLAREDFLKFGNTPAGLGAAKRMQELAQLKSMASVPITMQNGKTMNVPIGVALEIAGDQSWANTRVSPTPDPIYMTPSGTAPQNLTRPPMQTPGPVSQAPPSWWERFLQSMNAPTEAQAEDAEYEEARARAAKRRKEEEE